ncbi:hypothetical protein R7892_10195 [Ligilactobacillus murinus]|uniref:hypothetical protein n=1 Tax=Ligilactobacillus murinus TaxID=1622 RepID=UPI00296B43B2|nr:hypothetical protein [Ligilactobacillus murinus]WOY89036.1 hypothetical protein R7892_10195 [Ligilactobacillus murinus]
MLNTQVIYYRSEEGVTFYFRQKDRTLINDIERASRWNTKKEAQKVLHSLSNKALPNQTINVLPLLRVGSVDLLEEFEFTKTMLSSAEPTPQEVLLDDLLKMKQTDFLALLDDISRIITVLPELKKILKDKVKYEDSVVLQDYLHTLELGDFTPEEGYYIAKELQTSRQKRREIKDRLQLLSTLAPTEDPIMITTASAKETQKLLKTINEGRHYRYRSKYLEDQLQTLITS